MGIWRGLGGGNAVVAGAITPGGATRGCLTFQGRLDARQGVERQQKSLEAVQGENARPAVESGAAAEKMWVGLEVSLW